MRTITSFRTNNNRGFEGSTDKANELNLFFNRFISVGQAHLPSSSSAACTGRPPSTTPHSSPPCPPSYTPPSSSLSPLHTSGFQTDYTPHPEVCTPPPPVPSTVCFTADQVRKKQMKLNSNQVPGPDGVSPRVLKA